MDINQLCFLELKYCLLMSGWIVKLLMKISQTFCEIVIVEIFLSQITVVMLLSVVILFNYQLYDMVLFVYVIFY